MDKTPATPTVWLKIPFNNGVLRSHPFEDRHLTALKLAQTLRSADRKVNVMLNALADLLGEESYEQLIMAVMTGEVDKSAISDVLSGIVEGTKAYRESLQAAEAEPVIESID